MARQIYIDDKWKPVVYIGSSIIFVFSLIVGVVLGHYTLTAQFVPTAVGKEQPLLVDDILALGILAGLVPIAFTSYTNFHYLKSVERNIPRFLRDILQRTDSGLILPRALLEASKLDYGAVSHEMGIAMTKFSMGYDFGTSVKEAADRLRHPFARQFGIIIAEAHTAGGKTHEVLSSSVALFNDLEQYSDQRQSELKPYTQLVYISIAIYLVIAVIIITQFVAPFASIAKTSALGQGSVPYAGVGKFSLNAVPDISFYVSIFFISAVLESVFAGIIAGKIVDGSSAAGLRHSLLLLAIAILVFNLPL